MHHTDKRGEKWLRFINDIFMDGKFSILKKAKSSREKIGIASSSNKLLRDSVAEQRCFKLIRSLFPSFAASESSQRIEKNIASPQIAAMKLFPHQIMEITKLLISEGVYTVMYSDTLTLVPPAVASATREMEQGRDTSKAVLPGWERSA